MIDAFAEAVRSLTQVCHLVVVAPVAMTILAARGRWPAVAGAIGGIAAGGVVFVTRWIVLTDGRLRLSALLVIGVVAMIGLSHLVPAHRGERIERFAAGAESTWAVAGSSAVVGAIVTQWWRPCVGEALGEILTLAPNDPWGQLLPTIGFMLGISLPLLVIGLAYMAWQPSPAVATRIGVAATAVGIVLAASVVFGQHGEIVARLFQWSQ
ncbi:hypothetical protein [Ilumatobacter coccineus]|uniref:Uncharacterized protein n=1 Tax=Ilumatobacter coccineus (strain NBRC 103263 / KCTC 29153 / YM16-304) TaxID=1313172 RepID=A0A6C7E962_ILUCY|nr:hypothetical protein [Ilumatobacter coccineus]BAN02940.1 hypothetical protein YM304_26260 [Ilumatobacter coccineus YM16-304]